MNQTYKYFQPEYVKNFQCKGQACDAYCCKNWAITIDKKTYKKYSHIKPKSAAQEITRKIIKNDELKSYIVKLDKNKKCPFLTEDNWCSIQRKHGEDFLSETCATYPRITWNFGDFYERSLTLTCPAVAAQVLVPTEPIKFEMLEVPEKVHSNFGKIQVGNSLVPRILLDKIKLLQETAIAILQERTLTIDQRLLMLGLYFDKLDELLNGGNLENFEPINSAYKDLKFLQEQSEKFSSVIKFNVGEHIKIMFGILKTLYSDKIKKITDRRFIDAVANTLQIQTDENNQVSVKKLAEKYLELSTARKEFSKYYSTILENYLVNELFMNLYPFKIQGSITYNYGVFVTMYKLLELITFSVSLQNFFKNKEQLNNLDFTVIVMRHANNVDHNLNYMKKISEYLKGKDDIVEIMQSMLQV